MLAATMGPQLTSDKRLRSQFPYKSHLAVLEAVYIVKLKPELCVQKNCVWNVATVLTL